VRKSDFALVAVAVQLLVDDTGVCRRAAIGLGGVGGAPISADGVAKHLVGSELEKADLDAATGALQQLIEPHSDIHASAEYRRRVAGALLERAIIGARADATSKRP
jgi:CO/xanthine dehydrogenase FAD-binding subunit